MGPFDYNVDMGNPLGAFTQSFGQGMELQAMQRQQQAAQFELQQKQVAAQQQAVLRQAMTEFAGAQSPAEQIAVMTKYPDLAKPLRERYDAYDDAIKGALYDATIKPYALLKGGDTEGAIRNLQATAEAFRNSNRMQLAETFTKIAEIAKTSPQAALAMASAQLSANNATEFKLFGEALNQGGLTNFQRDLAASGVDPESDEGKRLAKQYVQNRVDPIVTMETPNGTQFIGPMSVYQARYGGGGGVPQQLPIVSNQAQYDALPSGSKFVYNGAIVSKP